MPGHQLNPWRTALPAAVLIAVANVVLLGLGRALGADMLVDPGSGVTEVGPGSVLLMSVAPALVGALALLVAARLGVRTWLLVGWLGLAVGLLSLAGPWSAALSVATALTLSSMHLLAGVVWLSAVRRAAVRARPPARGADLDLAA